LTFKEEFWLGSQGASRKKNKKFVDSIPRVRVSENENRHLTGLITSKEPTLAQRTAQHWSLPQLHYHHKLSKSFCNYIIFRFFKKRPQK
jgi:hypothetical protein